MQQGSALARAVEGKDIGEGGELEDTEGGGDDGYGQAVIEWNIKEAVGRAGGRARAFLRQLWWV